MQRFKLDLSFEQFLMFARGEHVDIAGVKFEVYESETPSAKWTMPSRKKVKTEIKAPVKPRARRRTKAEMEAARQLPETPPDTTQRAFPWQDKAMNTDPEAA